MTYKDEWKNYIALEEYYKIHCPDYKDETKLYDWSSNNN